MAVDVTHGLLASNSPSVNHNKNLSSRTSQNCILKGQQKEKRKFLSYLLNAADLDRVAGKDRARAKEGRILMPSVNRGYTYCHSSLGVEHSLSKRKVVGSNPACGYFVVAI
jgi:hypothetical protein